MADSNDNAVIIDTALIERNKENEFQDLDEKRKAFAYNYLSNGFNHRKAAEDCGFVPDRGISLKREPLIAAFIETLQSKTYEANLVTRSFIDSRLDELEDIAMGRVDTPIVLANGEEVLAPKFHGELAISVIKERNKMQGFVRDETGKIGDVVIQINNFAMTGEKPEPKEIEGEIIDE